MMSGAIPVMAAPPMAMGGGGPPIMQAAQGGQGGGQGDPTQQFFKTRICHKWVFAAGMQLPGLARRVAPELRAPLASTRCTLRSLPCGGHTDCLLVALPLVARP